MDIKKFIESVKESLNLEGFEKKGKKKSLKRLLEKLKSRREILHKVPKKKLSKKERKAYEEELAIITLQIKKAEKILEELNGNTKNPKGEKSRDHGCITDR
ncbi:hypothetical protein [Sulfurovum lithotrophicum]|uniref:hypothetical protein n=1 Tax=Sulfurovum lithotrophicum TaxID=206403 RepID=UPI000ABE7BCA|nr:hypothetical protein [Sulfurovum lithotrophicum]